MAFDEYFKQGIIQKALNRGQLDLKTFAKRHNIGYSTIQNWLRLHKLSNNTECEITRRNHDFPNKISHLLEAAKLDDESLGGYCREHGIYRQDLEAWKKELMNFDNKEDKKSASLRN